MPGALFLACWRDAGTLGCRFSVRIWATEPGKRAPIEETKFYQQILGLKRPWFVADVKIEPDAQQVDVDVEHPEGTPFYCPECGKARSVSNHTKSRQWRHLDTVQFHTILHANPPRVN